MVNLSVITATYNRQKKLQEIVKALSQQTLSANEYEVIVVDDGSPEPIKIPDDSRPKNLKLIRFEKNQERSVARSTGVEAAQGEILVFVDDDLILKNDFLENHLKAQAEWEKLLGIGKIILPPEKLVDPGILFRQELEMNDIPKNRGLVNKPNFATAANMSINRDLFLKLGGFNPKIKGIEDQDFALRHTKNGGNIAYLPEAIAIHNDDWLDFFSFCRRQEQGAEWMVVFSRLYPDFKDTVEREFLNGPLKLNDSLQVSAKKIIKAVLGTTPGKTTLTAAIKAIEKIAPGSKVLNRFYKMTLGVYLQKGYRRGIKNYNLTLKEDENILPKVNTLNLLKK
jgi:glycosyltransferase involved in cell wall biosynthesis